MKKIMLLLSCLSFFVNTAMCADFAYTARCTNSVPFNVLCSTSTATSLFTDDGTIVDVRYDNQSVYAIAISTYAIKYSVGFSTSTSNPVYLLPSGRTSYAEPMNLSGACFAYGIAIGTTPALMSGILEKQ